MAAKWIENLKSRLAANPLFWEGINVKCAKCGGSGKKVPLHKITNYNEFRTCCICKTVYR